MAKIAEYKFTDYDKWKSAQNYMYEAFGSSCYSDACWETSSYSDGYYISILDNCSNAGKAATICTGHDGKIY